MSIKKFFKKIITPDGHDGIKSKKDQTAHFILSLESLVVGELTLKDGEWKFQYSAHFKHQTEIKPLTDFPDVNKIYTSNMLWPFFSFRIPGLNQPHVQKVIEKRKIDKTNIVELLKTFGRESISSPFQLTAN